MKILLKNCALILHCGLILLLIFFATIAIGQRNINFSSSWSEEIKEFFILNGSSNIIDLNPIERVSLTPKSYLKNIHYKWNQNGFENCKTTILNYLQEGEYFSFEPTTLVYNRNGSIDRQNIGGSFIEHISGPDADLASVLNQENIEDVVPVFPKLSSYSFVPYLSLSMRDSLTQAGYTLIYNYPNYLEIEGNGLKLIYDQASMTKKMIYKNNNNLPETTIVDSYRTDNSYVYKINKLEQRNEILESGVCVIFCININYNTFTMRDRRGPEENLFTREAAEDSGAKAKINPIVFPNPTSSSFIIHYFDQLVPYNIELFDLTGNKIDYKVHNDGMDNIHISLMSYHGQVILLRYMMDGKPFFEKIIVLKN